MTKINEYAQLINELNQARDYYYNNSTPIMSDYEYDELFDKAARMEQELGITMSNSPTQTVGYEVKSKLTKVTHSHPMLSLGKTKSVRELVEFMGNHDSILSLKMDGLTVLLRYENGELMQAETRGNGEVGEIITHNAKVFQNIPLVIPYKGTLELEGEAIISYDNFDKINALLPASEQYKNPRNLASGTVRQLDSQVAAQRHVDFICWKVPTNMGSTMVDRFQFAEEQGFTVVPFVKVKSDAGEDDIQNLITEMQELAKKKSYPIDGMVMSYNDIAYGESLGLTGHHPKHSIAWKAYQEEEVTHLTDVEWTMGKSGTLTPVAIFEPVEIDGTEVNRASLHNVSIFKSFQMGIGDEITVFKANQIIPQIRDNLTRSDTCELPSVCPICGAATTIVQAKDTEVMECTNINCKGKLLGKLKHFVDRDSMDIQGLSEATLERLINMGLLTTEHPFIDVFNLYQHADDLLKLDKMGRKSVDNLMQAIENSKTIPMQKFIRSLGIIGVGRTQSKQLTAYFKNSIDAFSDALDQKFDFTTLEDFGSVTNTKIHEWYAANKAEYNVLVHEIINIEKAKENTQSEANLSGKTFVITGTVNLFKNRNELKDYLESRGAKVSGSVTSKTSFLINNDITSTSGKNKKAKELGIPIITEQQAIEL